MKETEFGERREVVLTYEASNAILEDACYKITKLVHSSRRLIKIIIKDAESGKTISTGVARCHPDDDWDVKVGEKIAMADALCKFHGIPKYIRWK